jgi:Fe-S-cluster containining protein
MVRELRVLRVKTECGSCTDKCCSQPYDWVYLTARESARLEAASHVPEEEFVVMQQNPNTGHAFRTLNLPCRFLDDRTGRCNVYESRPLICRMFPFYVDPLTGQATLMPSECGENLLFPSPEANDGWRLTDFEEDVREWLAEFWRDALTKE